MKSSDQLNTFASICLAKVAYAEKLTLLDQLLKHVQNRELSTTTLQGKLLSEKEMKKREKNHEQALIEIEASINDVKDKLEKEEDKKRHAPEF